MTTQAEHHCCQDDLPADLRALARACRTAARVAPQERARLIREAGEETVSGSNEYDLLVDAVADMAAARAPRQPSSGGSTSPAANGLLGNPLIAIGVGAIAAVLGIIGIVSPSAPTLPTDIARTGQIEDMTEIITGYEERIILLEQDDVAIGLRIDGVGADIDTAMGLFDSRAADDQQWRNSVEERLAQ